MKKRLLSAILAVAIMFSAVGCSSDSAKNETTNGGNTDMGSSSSKPVVISGWGGSMSTNEWVENTLIPFIKETEGVDAIWVPVDVNDLMVKLEHEKNAGSESEIDIIWINGENFKYAMEKDLLKGPFLEELPNAQKYLDLNSESNTLDFNFPTDGYESPWGQAQFVLVVNSNKVENTPSSAAELKKYLENNPGTFTYPIATDFTGSAFIRTVLYDIVGYENLKDLPLDYEQVKKAILPAMDYLNEIKPFLWNNGVNYPADLAELDKLYQDGIINFTMDYNSNTSYNQIDLGIWSEHTKTFVWDSGTPANTNFLAISKNTANYENAKKVINATLSPEMQASQSRLDERAVSTVLDMAKLSDREQELFSESTAGLNPAALKSLLSAEELSSKSVPELSPDLVVLIEEIWEEVILYA